MRIYGNRMLAICVTFLLVLGSIVVSNAQELNQQKSIVEREFFEDGSGFSIQNDLNKRIELSYNYVTIANNYNIQDQSIMDDLLDAREALANAKTPAQKYMQNIRLTESYIAVYDALGKIDLSQRHAEYRDSIRLDLDEKNNTIKNSTYNSNATEFNNKLNTFPFSILKLLGIVSSVSMFA
jgi:hypothetical protein